MKTLIAYLELFPTILASVKSLEEAIPLPQAGKQKLDLLLAAVKAAYDAEESIREDIPWEKLAGIVTRAVKSVVESLNAIGVFRRSPATTA